MTFFLVPPNIESPQSLMVKNWALTLNYLFQAPAQHFKNRQAKFGYPQSFKLLIIHFQEPEKTFSLPVGQSIINYFKHTTCVAHNHCCVFMMYDIRSERPKMTVLYPPGL